MQVIPSGKFYHPLVSAVIPGIRHTQHTRRVFCPAQLPPLLVPLHVIRVVDVCCRHIENLAGVTPSTILEVLLPTGASCPFHRPLPCNVFFVLHSEGKSLAVFKIPIAPPPRILFHHAPSAYSRLRVVALSAAPASAPTDVASAATTGATSADVATSARAPEAVSVPATAATSTDSGKQQGRSCSGYARSPCQSSPETSPFSPFPQLPMLVSMMCSPCRPWC